MGNIYEHMAKGLYCFMCEDLTQYTSDGEECNQDGWL